MDESLLQNLLPEEQVLWEGRPATGVFLRPIEAVLIPFSLLWLGFAIFWGTGVWTSHAPLFFKLFVLPLLAAGFYLTIGRFGTDILNRRKIRYFVTNQRILIQKCVGSSKFKSIDIKKLPVLELEERSNGSGTIKFGFSGSLFSGTNMGMGIWVPTYDQTPQFIRIDNVRSVYELIRQQAK